MFLVSFRSTVKTCLEFLVNWLHVYIDNQGTGLKAFCDVTLHGPFYATCQAVFYVVIFRHTQILDGDLKKGEHDTHVALAELIKWYPKALGRKFGL